MAKIINNLVLHGISGMLGSGSGRRCFMPKPRRRSLNTRSSPSHAASPRLMSPRPTSSIRPKSAASISRDIAGYRGAPGQSITINAVDDVKVATVGVLIADDNNTFIEKGQAIVSAQDPHRWVYTTTAAAPSASVKVVVDVADLAGQVVEETVHS